MFSSLSTKLAMRKMGISSETFNFTMPDVMGGGDSAPPREKENLTGGKLRKARPAGLDDPSSGDNAGTKQWPAWMTVKGLPLTVQPWLTPAPAPIPVATSCPQKGDQAPMDRDRKLNIGAGKPVVVVFLRCVGCAFAQKTFLNLRTLANRHAGEVTCIAVSHSSYQATQKWIDLLGGAWNVQVVIDEDRAVYAAWGLGLGSVWYVLNPSTQIQSWKETGWLGQSVASYMDRKKPVDNAPPAAGRGPSRSNTAGAAGNAGGAIETTPEGPATIMGNKWQQAGAFAVNGQGIVMWGEKALRADDVMDLNKALVSLGL
ncbi:hypothetical protein F503_01179 [Ophiostoma piceae UAMH 11346]|uniref:Alkyl hydroperoxide reductase subunit c thiol specific antioxidant n=1 Tax=Ophiostoma piceae (strain UAMH 11346) TaxID=1262450 RepID=S3C8X9_OPHP1|nr:hypothetical protein F503_01179 [Ophiostoma piceae UAMH 11346]